ncbi:alpha/beta-hydrolase [Hesseltinella vesiculosa]|uniref:Alpha/beta-hydrolase n=1 Tax=Hesseltinella vesiculosa TaxID=101127 RepID=A0A1X2GSF6_9FUNG|nr:alpha/beta-hydrolase [Hesseltinella vesiculosa]
MNFTRQQIKKNTPAGMTQAIVRQLLISPPSIARLALHDLTTPANKLKKHIKYIKSPQWNGALIGEDMRKETEADALERLKSADLVVFEVHGGGFRIGHCTMFMEAFYSWIQTLKKNHGLDCVIFSVEYTLAPKAAYPTPVRECERAYHHLVSDLGVSPNKIIASGDSCGGILILEMLCRVYAPGLLNRADAKRTNFDIPLPLGALLTSPVVSVNQTSESWKKYTGSDLVNHKLFELIIKEYIQLRVNKLDDMPMLNLFNTLTEQGGLGQIIQGAGLLVYVGEKEVFRDDILEFCDLVKKNSQVKVNVCKAKYPHDWYVIREIVRAQDIPMLKKCDEVTAKWMNHALKLRVLETSSEKLDGLSPTPSKL